MWPDIIHLLFCGKVNCENAEQWYENKPEGVIEKEHCTKYSKNLAFNAATESWKGNCLIS